MLDLRLKAIELRNNVFGPPYTEDDLTYLRTRADVENWTGFLETILETPKRRTRRWWIRHLLDGKILVYATSQSGDDPYEDEDPWELDR